MAFLVSHTLRATARSTGGYHASGWSPRLAVSLGGPVPAGAELVWRVARPGGALWFEQRMPVPVLADGEFGAVDLFHSPGGRDELIDGDGTDCAQPGTAAYTLRLVSELDGIDERLYEGVVDVFQLDVGALGVAAVDGVQPVPGQGDPRFAVRDDRMLDLAFLALDTVDEPDAPRLAVTVFLGGDVDAFQVEAHCFRDGQRFAQASRVTNPHTFTATDGAVLGREFVFAFDDARGWNTLRETGWGADWHLLDANDGAYEVKVVRERTVTRLVAFDVRDGRIRLPGAVTEIDPVAGVVLMARASIRGELDGPRHSRLEDPVPPDATFLREAFHGAAPDGGRWGTVDDLYALQPHASSAEGAALDERAAAALQAFFDRVERLVMTWEEEFTPTLASTPAPASAPASASFDFGQVLAAEAVLSERAGALALQEAAASVSDDHQVQLNGERTTVGGLRARLNALFAAAEARVSAASQQSDEGLAPFRAVLSGDKLSVFADHPADSFVYTTSGRRVIETPEQLAEAEWWYFEGPVELAGTATVDGVRVTVSTQGWRVVGWRFDAEGSIIDHVETQGQGASAPLSAYP